MEARLTEDGDLIIEGHDIGPSVQRFWGARFRECEWAILVRAANVPQLVAVLGGSKGDDVLSLLSSQYSDDERYLSKTFLDERAVLNEFWNRLSY